MTNGPSQALNLGGRPSAYSDVFVTLDLMKGVGDWEYWTGQSSVITPANLLKLDAQGWLTDLPVINGMATSVMLMCFMATFTQRRPSLWNGRARGRLTLMNPIR